MSTFSIGKNYQHPKRMVKIDKRGDGVIMSKKRINRFHVPPEGGRLRGKPGENPARTRRCKGRVGRKMPLKRFGKARQTYTA